MATKQHILGLIDAGREIRRAPLVGMQFLHQGPMRASDPRSFCRRTPPRGAARTRIAVRVFTPTGLPAVKISCK